MFTENSTVWEVTAVMIDTTERTIILSADSSIPRTRVKEILLETSPTINKIVSVKKSRSQKSRLSVA